MAKEKYMINLSTGTLHIVGMCAHSRKKAFNGKLYRTEDDAIKDNQRYMRYCKNCFKGRE